MYCLARLIDFRLPSPDLQLCLLIIRLSRILRTGLAIIGGRLSYWSAGCFRWHRRDCRTLLRNSRYVSRALQSWVFCNKQTVSRFTPTALGHPLFYEMDVILHTLRVSSTWRQKMQSSHWGKVKHPSVSHLCSVYCIFITGNETFS